MEDHSTYLNNDADDDERRAAARVLEGLNTLRLEAKVREAALERQALQRRSWWRRMFWASVVLVLIAGATLWLLNPTVPPPAPASTPIVPAPQITPPPTPQAVPAPTPPAPAKQRPPMAQLNPNERLPDPRFAAPETGMIRGDQTPDPQLKALLDQVWYTDYPLEGLTLPIFHNKADQLLRQRNFEAAYLALERLERTQADSFSRRMERRNQQRMREDSTARPIAAMSMPNDTLLYLKAYCVLEMGEGQEALMYLDQIRDLNPAWAPQMAWYRGLALLSSSKRAEALLVFKTIAALPKHAYRKQAEKAIRLLE
jgi:tetratricopeptide (TPR) repeat protein